jgi:uncharacterized protein YbaR (Trm112 family)
MSGVRREIDPRLLEVLVCPLSKGALVWNAEDQELVCKESGLAYAVRDGVPVMLIEEAGTLD